MHWITIIGIILIAIGTYFTILGQNKDNKQTIDKLKNTISEKHSKLEENQKVLIKKNEEIKRLQEKLHQGQQDISKKIDQILAQNKPELMNAYPSGYTGLGIKDDKYIPPKEFKPKIVTPILSTGKILDNTKTSITILLPNMVINTPAVKNFIFEGNEVTLMKTVGNTVNLIGVAEHTLQVKILEIDEKRDLLVVGIGLIRKNN